MKNINTLLKLFVFSSFLCLFSLAANAQSKKISLQGFLKDANGKAVADGNKVLTFKIYNAITAGTLLWTKTFSQVSVVGGVYAVQLGASDAPEVEISTLLWNVPYYVGITVESEPELAPRTEFTYAPYTFAVNKTNKADTATYALTAGAIGGALDLATGGFAADMRIIRNSMPITGTNPDNNIRLGDGSGTTSSLKLFSNNVETMTVAGGNVGIRTITPTATLDVARGNGVDGTARFLGTIHSSHFNYSTAENTHIRGGKVGSAVFINDTHNGNVLIASGGGLVGIGLTIPSATLDVARGNTNSTTAIFRGSNHYSIFNFGTAEETIITGGKNGAGVLINNDHNGDVSIAAGGGQVGIGLTTADATLDVARGSGAQGTARFKGTLHASNFNYGTNEETYLRGGKTGASVYINDSHHGNVNIADGGGNVNIAAGGGNVNIATGGGNVGIGTQSPLFPLDINSPLYGSVASATRIYFDINHQLTIDASGSGNIKVRANGWYYSDGGGFICTSDKRIKNIIGISQSEKDLSVLNKIEITDYRYKDELTNGAGLQKKVIAQQVQEIYPMAINTQKGIIPNVFAVAREVKLNGQATVISTTQPHDFKTGDLVKIILEKTGEKQLKVEVINANTFSVAEAINDKIFVYGKHIDDLLTVDYDALAMLNVSATQELSKQIELLKAENAKLKSENKTYESRLTKIEALLQTGQSVSTGK